MIGVDAEDLRPPLSAGVFETMIDVLEGLVDLSLDLGVVFPGLAIPTT